jgi:tetratricopeptide (TPR) repeat protein
MQCAKCQTTVELPASGAAPTSCPRCGAPLQADSPAPAGRPEPAARNGATLWIAIFLILIVGLAAVSVVSTIYAMRMVEERDRAKEDLAQSSNTIDEIVVAVANSDKLKGATAAEARQAILQPVADHYAHIIEKYHDDKKMQPAVASAQLHQAAVQAKLGLPECVKSLSGGLGTINTMLKSDFGEESYPSFRDSVRIAAPMDWITVKGSTPAGQGAALYSNLRAGVTAYRELNKRFPKSVVFRDDLAELLKSSAMLLGFIRRNNEALTNWVEARDVLETMVRDEPDNADFQERLTESLVNAARLENSSGETDKAIADYQRAVEVRQKMAEANPEDKSLEQALTRVQRDLERVETAAASKKEAPEGEKSADEASEKVASEKQPAKDDAPEKQPAKEEAPKEETPKDNAPQE